jgi:hypothetical protein
MGWTQTWEESSLKTQCGGGGGRTWELTCLERDGAQVAYVPVSPRSTESPLPSRPVRNGGRSDKVM